MDTGKFDGIDKAAQDFIDGLGLLVDCDGNAIHRFTPSVKLGRRYLIIEGIDGFVYSITVEVSRKDAS